MKRVCMASIRRRLGLQRGGAKALAVLAALAGTGARSGRAGWAAQRRGPVLVAAADSNTTVHHASSARHGLPCCRRLRRRRGAGRGLSGRPGAGPQPSARRCRRLSSAGAAGRGGAGGQGHSRQGWRSQLKHPNVLLLHAGFRLTLRRPCLPLPPPPAAAPPQSGDPGADAVHRLPRMRARGRASGQDQGAQQPQPLRVLPVYRRARRGDGAGVGQREGRGGAGEGRTLIRLRACGGDVFWCPSVSPARRTAAARTWRLSAAAAPSTERRRSGG